MMKDFIETLKSATRFFISVTIYGLAVILSLFGLMFIGYTVSQAIKLMFS